MHLQQSSAAQRSAARASLGWVWASVRSMGGCCSTSHVGSRRSWFPTPLLVPAPTWDQRPGISPLSLSCVHQPHYHSFLRASAVTSHILTTNSYLSWHQASRIHASQADGVPSGVFKPRKGLLGRLHRCNLAGSPHPSFARAIYGPAQSMKNFDCG